MKKSYRTRFDNSDEYYEWAAGTKVNKPFHYAASRALFGAMAVKNGLFVADIPESVKALTTPAVVATTHRSWLDIPYFVQTTERAGLRFARPIARDSLFDNPVVAWMFHQWGAVAVDRSKPNFEGINKALGAFLDAGNSVNAFTEQTRVKTDTRTVLPPKRTALILAVRHHVPIVPMAIAGVAVDDERNWFGRGKDNGVVAMMGEPMHMPAVPEGSPRQQELFIRAAAREHVSALHAEQQRLLDAGYDVRASM